MIYSLLTTHYELKENKLTFHTMTFSFLQVSLYLKRKCILNQLFSYICIFFNVGVEIELSIKSTFWLLILSQVFI